MVKVSIILPIYNGKLTDYENAFNSVLKQECFNDMELIVVDDCSTKNNEYWIRKAYEYKNVLFISCSKNHGNPSHCRNVGLDLATGEYITFLDQDDTLNNLTPILSIHGDMIIGGVNVNNNMETNLTSGIISSTKLFKDYHKLFDLEFLTVWSTLYRKSFIDEHEIRFNEDCLEEDILFNFNCYLKVNTIYMISDIVYNYNVNPYSLHNQLNWESIRFELKGYREVYNLLLINDYGELAYLYMASSVSELLNTLLNYDVTDVELVLHDMNNLVENFSFNFEDKYIQTLYSLLRQGFYDLCLVFIIEYKNGGRV